MKSHGLLKSWILEYDMSKERYYISGYIFNDKKNRFPDGQKIKTSSLLMVNWEKGFCKTKNSTYLLD